MKNNYYVGEQLYLVRDDGVICYVKVTHINPLIGLNLANNIPSNLYVFESGDYYIGRTITKEKRYLNLLEEESKLYKNFMNSKRFADKKYKEIFK